MISSSLAVAPVLSLLGGVSLAGQFFFLDQGDLLWETDEAGKSDEEGRAFNLDLDDEAINFAQSFSKDSYSCLRCLKD